jgi:uncharacterized membrane protein YhaH (DUF805 family)/Tfp pilus assembly major pilin PilA
MAQNPDTSVTPIMIHRTRRHQGRALTLTPFMQQNACSTTKENRVNNPYAASNTSTDGNMPQQAGQTYEPEIFALNGRLGRIRYLAYGIIINIVIMVVAGVLLGVLAAVIGSSNPGVFGILGFLIYVPILAVSFILAKRRLNDLDQSGWLGLLLIVPLVNFFFGLYLLFAPGTRGPNRYGAEPCANNTGLIVVACLFPVGIMFVGILAAVAIPAYATYTKKAKFSEVVLSTSGAKVAVEICAQDNAQNGVIAGCGGGANGVPPDVTSPKGMVASITTADNGTITATAISENGLQGQTYILVPTFNNGKVTWVKEGTCTSGSPSLC